MEITSVTVKKFEKEGSRMKGIASVLLDDSFAVHDTEILLIQLILMYANNSKMQLLMHIIKKKNKNSQEFFLCSKK